MSHLARKPTGHSVSSSISDDGEEPIKNRRNLYVANVDNSVTESDLKSKFARYGTIISVVLTHRPPLPGRGFVNFTTHAEAAKAATALDNTLLKGKRIRVDFAFTKKPQPVSRSNTGCLSGNTSVPLATKNGPSHTTLSLSTMGGKGITLSAASQFAAPAPGGSSVGASQNNAGVNGKTATTYGSATKNGGNNGPSQANTSSTPTKSGGTSANSGSKTSAWVNSIAKSPASANSSAKSASSANSSSKGAASSAKNGPKAPTLIAPNTWANVASKSSNSFSLLSEGWLNEVDDSTSSDGESSCKGGSSKAKGGKSAGGVSKTKVGAQSNSSSSILKNSGSSNSAKNSGSSNNAKNDCSSNSGSTNSTKNACSSNNTSSTKNNKNACSSNSGSTNDNKNACSSNSGSTNSTKNGGKPLNSSSNSSGNALSSKSSNSTDFAKSGGHSTNNGNVSKLKMDKENGAVRKIETEGEEDIDEELFEYDKNDWYEEENTGGDKKRNVSEELDSKDNIDSDQDSFSYADYILPQVETAVLSVFDKDNLALVKELKAHLEEELHANFADEKHEKIIETLMEDVERSMKSLDSINLSGEENVKKCLQKLKESIRKYYGSETVNEKKKRKHYATMMKDVDAVLESLTQYGEVHEQKAMMVAQFIILEEHMKQLLGSRNDVTVRDIETRVEKLQATKTLFLTDDIRVERRSRLEHITENLKDLYLQGDAEEIFSSIFGALQEEVKLAYLCEPTQPKLGTQAKVGKQAKMRLDTLRNYFTDLQTDREAKLHMLYELNVIEAEIAQANKDGIRTFVAEQKEKVAAEANLTKSDALSEDFSGDFWTDVETFLAENFEMSLKERQRRRDMSVNLYVNNLDASVDESLLRSEFARFGKVVSVFIPKLVAGRKIFGFVKFEVAEDAVKAMEEMDGSWLNSKQMEVSVARQVENIKTYWMYLLDKSLKM